MSLRPFRDIKRKTKEINVGKVKVGGNNPITVQSMTNTLTTDIKTLLNKLMKFWQVRYCEFVQMSHQLKL